MATLPALIDEDVERINAALNDFLSKSEAQAALVTAEGGFVIFHAGNMGGIDVTALGTLAANACYATQAIADQIDEPNFSTMYQQGEKLSLLVSAVDKYHSLIVVFPAHLSVGAVKYYAAQAIQSIGDQLKIARSRNPSKLIDPVRLNLRNTTELFKRKA